ncbi:MAG: ribonuclease III family protein [Candidatus Ranarchaeia archaeon]
MAAYSLRDIALNKGLAKLGDIITNLVYSLAKSLAQQAPTGAKVSGKALANALRLSGIRSNLPGRLSLHQRSDAAEAIIAYLWLTQKYTIDQMVQLLHSEFVAEDFKSRVAEERAAIRAFTEMFNKIEKALPPS